MVKFSDIVHRQNIQSLMNRDIYGCRFSITTAQYLGTSDSGFKSSSDCLINSSQMNQFLVISYKNLKDGHQTPYFVWRYFACPLVQDQFLQMPHNFNHPMPRNLSALAKVTTTPDV